MHSAGLIICLWLIGAPAFVLLTVVASLLHGR